MAVSAAKVSDGENVVGKFREIIFDITLDASYVALGMPVAASIFGLSKVFGMKIIGGNAAAGVLNFWYDTTNAKLIALCPTGGATTAPTSLADPAVTTGASTASAVNATTPALTPGQAKEIAATANLSTLVVRAVVIGY